MKTQFMLLIIAVLFPFFGHAICDSEERALSSSLGEGEKVAIAAAKAKFDACRRKCVSSGECKAKSTNATTTLEKSLVACEQAARATVGSCATDDDNSTLSSARAELEKSSDELEDIGKSDKSKTRQACQQAARASKTANDALGQVQSGCSGAVGSCQSRCEDVGKQVKQAGNQSLLKRWNIANQLCSGGRLASGAIDSDSSMLGNSTSRADQCQNDVGSGGMPEMPQANNKEEEKAKDCHNGANPNDPACVKIAQDCTNGQVAASNPVCKCFLNGECGSTTRKDAMVPQLEGGDSSAGSSGGYAGEASSTKGIREFQDGQGAGGVSIPGSGGGGGGGSSSGANQPGLKYQQDGSSLNTAILAGHRGQQASGASGGAGGAHLAEGKYTDSGAWVPDQLNKKGAGVQPPLNRATASSGLVAGQIADQSKMLFNLQHHTYENVIGDSFRYSSAADFPSGARTPSKGKPRSR